MRVPWLRLIFCLALVGCERHAIDAAPNPVPSDTGADVEETAVVEDAAPRSPLTGTWVPLGYPTRPATFWSAPLIAGGALLHELHRKQTPSAPWVPVGGPEKSLVSPWIISGPSGFTAYSENTKRFYTLGATGSWVATGGQLANSPANWVETPGGALVVGNVLGYRRSSDRGKTWTEIDLPATCNRLRVRGSAVIVACSDQWRVSRDDGRTFAPPIDKTEVNDLALVGDTMCAATRDGRLFAQSGTDWIDRSPAEMFIGQLAVADGAVFAAAISAGQWVLLRSRDACSTWTVVHERPRSSYAPSLGMAADQKIVLFGDESSADVSSDGGDSFAPLETFETMDVTGFAVLGGAPADHELWVTNSKGALRSSDGGASWTHVLDRHDYPAVLADNAAGVVYIGKDFDGDWPVRIERGGSTPVALKFRHIPLAARGGVVATEGYEMYEQLFSFDRGDSLVARTFYGWPRVGIDSTRMIFASDGNGLARSINGINWKSLILPPSAIRASLTVGPDDALYMRGTKDAVGDRLYVSRDRGETWEQRGAVGIAGTLVGVLSFGSRSVVVTSANETVYRRVYFSYDDGETFVEVTDELPERAVPFDAAGRLYMQGVRGLYRFDPAP